MPEGALCVRVCVCVCVCVCAASVIVRRCAIQISRKDIAIDAPSLVIFFFFLVVVL